MSKSKQYTVPQVVADKFIGELHCSAQHTVAITTHIIENAIANGSTLLYTQPHYLIHRYKVFKINILT
jgi:hypothetical protein